MFELIPIYNPHAVINTWGQISDGVDEVLKYTNGDSSRAKILNEILSGNVLLWVGYSDGEYCGYVTTRIDDIPTCYKCLSIVHLYVKDGKWKEIMLEGLNKLGDFAKSQGCTKFRMWTLRDKAFNRVLEPEGWVDGYSEFTKEVE